MRMAVRALLVALQLPLLVVIGLRYWKRKTVPDGRSLMRFPRAEKTVELEELLEDDEVVVVVLELAVVVVVVLLDFENAEATFLNTDEIVLTNVKAAPTWAAIADGCYIQN